MSQTDSGTERPPMWATTELERLKKKERKSCKRREPLQKNARNSKSQTGAAAEGWPIKKKEGEIEYASSSRMSFTLYMEWSKKVCHSLKSLSFVKTDARKERFNDGRHSLCGVVSGYQISIYGVWAGTRKDQLLWSSVPFWARHWPFISYLI